MILMNNHYSAEFKLEAVKRIERTKEPVSKVAADLGIKPTTLQGWVKKYKQSTNAPFPGSGNLSPEDEKLRKLERENRELKEEIEILKKAGSFLRQEPKVKRFEFIKANCNKYRIAKLCEVLCVSRSSYYAWDKRPQSKREIENRSLLRKIQTIHNKSGKVFGSIKITQIINKEEPKPINHKRVERLMSENGIRSRVSKKFRATTKSNHKLPVAENILNRGFSVDKPNVKMVSDITYLWTDEGWLYIAGVMDLCGQKIVGLSMSERMTKELVINALNDAYQRAGKPNGVILHSDRGSQYCSYDYQNLIKKYGFICSMSRKGNCWDNAPMESFWGKLKCEWLYGKHFKTRDEARAAVFEYVQIFYNRQRIHASNGYLTPDEFYNRANKKVTAA
ncbi:IS3 family transposase [Desnuesiella massiliensis]|uniref:IS3 family transposase n=1 Tax=Desnuesiella massiliensis TaxID=1650662 RepID=UPI0012B5102C|nr:IS3 family transposase [Desnuesiella massiliensis]